MENLNTFAPPNKAIFNRYGGVLCDIVSGADKHGYITIEFFNPHKGERCQIETNTINLTALIRAEVMPDGSVKEISDMDVPGRIHFDTDEEFEAACDNHSDWTLSLRTWPVKYLMFWSNDLDGKEMTDGHTESGFNVSSGQTVIGYEKNGVFNIVEIEK